VLASETVGWIGADGDTARQRLPWVLLLPVVMHERFDRRADRLRIKATQPHQRNFRGQPANRDIVAPAMEPIRNPPAGGGYRPSRHPVRTSPRCFHVNDTDTKVTGL
jgi:hypothetical protein